MCACLLFLTGNMCNRHLDQDLVKNIIVEFVGLYFHNTHRLRGLVKDFAHGKWKKNLKSLWNKKKATFESKFDV